MSEPPSLDDQRAEPGREQYRTSGREHRVPAQAQLDDRGDGSQHQRRRGIAQHQPAGAQPRHLGGGLLVVQLHRGQQEERVRPDVVPTARRRVPADELLAWTPYASPGQHPIRRRAERVCHVAEQVARHHDRDHQHHHRRPAHHARVDPAQAGA
ncbi:MAG: hypothetical protein ACRDTE_00850 [Pseudonocardiaceae bacterium]